MNANNALFLKTIKKFFSKDYEPEPEGPTMIRGRPDAPPGPKSLPNPFKPNRVGAESRVCTCNSKHPNA